MCDVRLNDNINHTSGINLEGPNLIRRSRKVWDPPKNGPIAPMASSRVNNIPIYMSYCSFLVLDLGRILDIGSCPSFVILILVPDIVV